MNQADRRTWARYWRAMAAEYLRNYMDQEELSWIAIHQLPDADEIIQIRDQVAALLEKTGDRAPEVFYETLQNGRYMGKKA